MQETVKVVVCDCYKEPQFCIHLENGYAERPELWVNSALAASPEELQKVLRRAEERWKEIGKGAEERKNGTPNFLQG